MRYLSTLLLLLLVGCASGPASDPARSTFTRINEASRAQARWEARPFEAYRMTVSTVNEAGSAALVCGFEVVVRGGRVEKSLANTCFPPVAMTMDGIFARATMPDVRACAAGFAGGCACIRMQTVKVTFDEQLGYPTYVSLFSTSRMQWWHPDYWRYLVEARRQPWCARGAFTSERTLTVEQLAPVGAEP